MLEINIYDKTGHPRIYLSCEFYDSFYTWDGHAVAYLEEDKIYGWKGKHIGWYIDGVIYDMNGYKVGSNKENCPYVAVSEVPKHSKYNRIVRFEKVESLYSRPSLKLSYTDRDLVDFISQNKVY